MNVDKQFLYNGYLFHEYAENKLYNSAMILYYLDKNRVNEGSLKELIDLNLKTDYSRIKLLLKKKKNIEILEQIIENDNISTEVISRFPIDKIHDKQNFLSLLFYMGLVTKDKDAKTGKVLLKIPNYSIKTMYWEYMEN